MSELVDAGRPEGFGGAVDDVDRSPGQVPFDTGEPSLAGPIDEIGLVGEAPVATSSHRGSDPRSGRRAAHHAVQPTGADRPPAPDGARSDGGTVPTTVQRSSVPAVETPVVRTPGAVEGAEVPSPPSVDDHVARSPTDGPVVALERLVRTVVGPPIVRTVDGPPARQRDPIGPPGSAPSTARDGAPATADASHRPLPRTDRSAPGNDVTAPSSGRQIPTLGSGRGLVVPALDHDDLPTVATPHRPVAQTDVLVPLGHRQPRPSAAGDPDTGSGQAPIARDPDTAPVGSRPTLAGAPLPTVARRPVDPAGGIGPRPSSDPAPPVQAGGAVDGALGPSMSGFGPAPLDTSVSLLDGRNGRTGSTGLSRAPTTPRTVVGPPIIRATVQRDPTPLSANDGPRPLAAAHRTPAETGASDPDDAGPSQWPPVQLERSDDAVAPPSDETGVTATTTLTAEATTGPAALDASSPVGRSDAEVDELLHALYPPLRRRLCRDLLLDRERAGYGTDIRF